MMNMQDRNSGETNQTEGSNWLLRWTRGLCVLLLIFAICCLFGARYIELFDLPGFILRYALHFPIKTTTVSLPPSPAGTWQLNVVRRQWSYHDASDMSSYELVVHRRGKPFEGGRNLDQVNRARGFTSPYSKWLNDSTVAFESQPFSTATATTLTLVNATDAAVPLAQIHTAITAQSILFFDVPAHSSQVVQLRIVGGDNIVCAAMPKFSAFKAIPPKVSSLSGIKIILRENADPAIEFLQRSNERSP